MRRIVFALMALLALSAVAATAQAARRYTGSSSRNSDGVWQKTYGWGGYGWYSVNGDYIGYDGYSSIRTGIGRNLGGSSAYARPYPGSIVDRPSIYGY